MQVSGAGGRVLWREEKHRRVTLLARPIIYQRPDNELKTSEKLECRRGLARQRLGTQPRWNASGQAAGETPRINKLLARCRVIVIYSSRKRLCT